MKILKIFLASSDELNDERKEISLFIQKENNILVKKDIFLEIVVWEDLLQSFNCERIQDSFNKEMLKCDIVIVLFYKKIGQFTKEEFETAYKSLKSGKNPKYLFVFFKTTDISIDEVNEEIVKVNNLKHQIKVYEQIYRTFENKDNLINKIQKQLYLIINKLQIINDYDSKSNIENIQDTKNITSLNNNRFLDEHRQEISPFNALIRNKDLLFIMGLGIIAKVGFNIVKEMKRNDSAAFKELSLVLFNIFGTVAKISIGEIKDKPLFLFFQQKDLFSELANQEKSNRKIQSYIKICEIFANHLFLNRQLSFNIESTYSQELDSKQISDTLWKIFEKNGSMSYKEAFYLEYNYHLDLNMHKISDKIVSEFEKNDMQLNQNAKVLILKKNESWLIRCNEGGYKIERDGEELLVYTSNDSISSIEKTSEEWIVTFSCNFDMKREMSFLVKNISNELCVYKQTSPYFRTSEAIKYIYNKKDVYYNIIKEFKITKILSTINKYGIDEAKIWDEIFWSLIRAYCIKLEKRCLSLELLGVRGAANIDVELTDIFVTLSLFKNVPDGGIARIYSEAPHDRRVLEYLQAYRETGAISVKEIFKKPKKMHS